MYTPIVENELKNKNCNDIIHAAWKMTNQTHTKKYIRKLKQKKNIYTNVHPHNGSANSTLN